jgi:hypothetical protein
MIAERVKAKVVALHVEEVAAPIQAAKASTMLAGDMEFVAMADDDGEVRKRTKAIDEEFEDMIDYCWDRQVEFEGKSKGSSCGGTCRCARKQRPAGSGAEGSHGHGGHGLDGSQPDQAGTMSRTYGQRRFAAHHANSGSV